VASKNGAVPRGQEDAAIESRTPLQGQGQLVQSLTATPAILRSPMFTAPGGQGDPAGFQQGLVEAVISHPAPVVGLSRVHEVCGGALQRASFRLEDFFMGEVFGDDPADGEEQPAKRQCTGEREGAPLLQLIFLCPPTLEAPVFWRVRISVPGVFMRRPGGFPLEEISETWI
jgi:hypothetical protein